MLIRPYAREDASGLYQAAAESVAQVQPWMPWCHDRYSLADAESWTTHQIAAFEARTEFDFVIVDDTGTIIGGCGLNQFDAANRRANMGYWVRTSSAGHGYATMAVKQLVSWAISNTQFQRLEVVVAVRNLASLRVAQKAGAIREGVLRSRLLLHGEFHDALMHAFIRQDPAAGS